MIMLFSSMSFIFLFLPTVLVLYFLLPDKFRNAVLLAASIIFYAWGEALYCFVMVAVALINYLAALMMKEKYRLAILSLAIAADLGVLIYFKYTGFIIENINALFASDIPLWQAALPVGISFYIFQSISYIADVYRREILVQRNFFKLLLFISFFPQMVAGPILKYHDVLPYLDKRSMTPDNFAYGLKRFISGLSKKMLIANVLGTVADRVFEGNGIHYPVWMSWIGVLAYTLQIYYDFSGYSDMAIGLGALFGFKFMENFNYPYISKSVTEFWRRWHISLSTWFREYLYIPLGGNRVSKWRNICNLFIVFLATGIWHGASWNFVLWGVWHGLFLALEKFTKIHEKIPRVLSHICTAAVFFFGWILFRSPTAADALAMVKRMTGFAEKSEILLPAELFLNNEEIMVFAAALFLIFPVWGKWAGLSAEKLPIPLWRRVAVNTVLCLLFILSVMKIATTTSNPFIYFRF